MYILDYFASVLFVVIFFLAHLARQQRSHAAFKSRLQFRLNKRDPISLSLSLSLSLSAMKTGVNAQGISPKRYRLKTQRSKVDIR